MTDNSQELQALMPAKFEPIVDTEKMEPGDREKAMTIAKQIDVGDSRAILEYGLGAQQEVSTFADQVLSDIRTSDTGEAGELLTNLLAKIKEMDVDGLSGGGSFLSKIPLIGSMVDSVKGFLARYDKIQDSIDKIVAQLDGARMELLKDIKQLDDMYHRSMDYLKQLDVHIAAGQIKLDALRDQELPAAQEKAQTSGDQADVQRFRDLVQFFNRFEKKLHDLKLSRMVSLQSAPQIRLIQGGNQVLVEKIQSSLVNTIPLWKNQIVIAISLFRQKKALDLQREATNTTNELLQKNSEMLKEGATGIARENERGIVDLETLKKVNTDLVTTIEDILKIQSEGRAKRAQAEQELIGMEKELKAKLSQR